MSQGWGRQGHGEGLEQGRGGALGEGGGPEKSQGVIWVSGG